MANIKITELPSATSITNDDLLVTVDNSSPPVTKKITFENIKNGLPQSSRVIYASKHGCALNSNINTGGGTDDTAALQAILDLAQDGKPLEVIIDGVARVSTLRVWRNTTIRCLSGAGVFQTGGSNWHLLTTGYVLPTEPSHDNISIIGGTWNCNAAHQSKWELNQPNPYNGSSTTINNGRIWNLGFWIGWGKNFIMRDVIIKNSKTYSLALMELENTVIENLQSIWDDGDENLVYGTNKDGIHLYGTIKNMLIKNYSCINGDDDSIAFNTDENMDLGIGVGLGNLIDPRWTGMGGDIYNVTVDGCYLNSTNGIRVIGYANKRGLNGNGINPKIDHIFLKNIYGRITNLPMQWFGSFDAGLFSIDGWHVTGQNEIYMIEPYPNEVHLNNIRQGTPITIYNYYTLTLGNGFEENQGWSGTGLNQVGGLFSEYGP